MVIRTGYFKNLFLGKELNWSWNFGISGEITNLITGSEMNLDSIDSKNGCNSSGTDFCFIIRKFELPQLRKVSKKSDWLH